MNVGKQASRVLSVIGNRALSVSRRLYSETGSIQAERVKPWLGIRGDETLRLDYDLDEDSLVLDVGGYQGQWASDIFAKYCCSIHVCEPVSGFSENIKRRFARNQRIHVHPFGLGNATQFVKMTVCDDGSSAYSNAEGDAETVRLVRGMDFIQKHRIHKLNLVKINIEGGEYDLLEHFIQTSFIFNIENIQIQFHDFVPKAERRMQAIQNRLAQTHYLTYQYPFVWENWRLRSESCGQLLTG